MKTPNLAAAIAAIMAGTLATSIAQAAPNASAEAVTTLQNFQINNLTTGKQADYSNVTSAAGNQTSTANLNGTSFSTVSNVNTATPGVNIASTQTIGTPSPSTIATELANNTAATPSAFTVTPLPNTNNFGGAGTNDVGSAVTNTPGNTAATSATLYSASYAALTSAGTAGSSTDSSLVVKFNLVNAAGVLNFSGLIGAYAGAFLSAGNGLSAKSDFNISFQLTDVAGVNKGQNAIDFTSLGAANFKNGANYAIGGQVSDSTPGLGSTQEASAYSAINNIAPASDSLVFNAATGALVTYAFAFDTLNLLATDTYQLTLTSTTDSSVALNVPEPGILALMGIGLLVLGIGSSNKFAKESGVTYA